MRDSYYAMKRSLGGEKMTLREKLCWNWTPCPGCNIHASVIGTRRAGILFEHYSRLDNKAHLVYWRSHAKEWDEVQRKVRQT